MNNRTCLLKITALTLSNELSLLWKGNGRVGKYIIRVNKTVAKTLSFKFKKRCKKINKIKNAVEKQKNGQGNQLSLCKKRGGLVQRKMRKFIQKIKMV